MCFKLYIKYNVKSCLLQIKINFFDDFIMYGINPISKGNHSRKNNVNTDLKYPIVIIILS